MKSTRAEVAKLAGVSPAVVSYVLNGGPRNVAPETRRRVEEAIASLEYRPNAIAKALRGGRSGAAGVVVGSGQEALFRAVWPPLHRAAAARGYVMYVSFANDAVTEKQYLRALVDRQVDALIVVELDEPGMLSELREEGLPIAYIGEKEPPARVLSLNTCPSVPNKELLAAVARCRPPMVLISSELATWLTLPEVSLATGDTPVICLDFSSAHGGSTFIQALRSNPRTVIMCSTDDELDRLYWLAGSSGLDTQEYLFTNSRVDLSNNGDTSSHIQVQWDLDRPFLIAFSELIRQVDNAEPSMEVVELPWRLLSPDQPSKNQARVWSVGDM